jgi:hypothetical protein
MRTEVFEGFSASGSKQWYLKKGLDGAVLAAESGCTFYEMVLDVLLFNQIVPSWVSDGSKRSTMRFLVWFNRCEPWRADFNTQFGNGGLGQRERIGTSGHNVFSVWARERGMYAF